MTLPALGPAQRAAAVAAASRTRAHRAGVKAALKSGDLSLAEVLDRAEPELDRMPVAELLKSLPRVGPVRAAEIMDRIGIAANRRLGGLGVIQRAALVRELS